MIDHDKLLAENTEKAVLASVTADKSCSECHHACVCGTEKKFARASESLYEIQQGAGWLRGAIYDDEPEAMMVVDAVVNRVVAHYCPRYTPEKKKETKQCPTAP